MVLNKVAVSERRGFFYYLLNRERLNRDTIGGTNKESLETKRPI